MLAVLRCPETRQPLSLATPEQISDLDCAVDGTTITHALMREDGQVAYPVDDGYPVLLLDRQIRKPDGGSW